MEKKPYHHLPDGTFRNPEGSPERNSNFKWSFRIFNKKKKNLNMTVPQEHVVEKAKVLSDLEKLQDDDYIGWIGHATFLIKLGNTTIITDPVFSKNAGPLFFGPKRFTEPALKLREIPKTDLFLLTHNHYDHQDMTTIRRFPYKDSKVMLPLNLGKYFKRNGYKDVNEMDWYDEININENLKVTLLPAVHWSKRSLTDTNKTLWGNFLIEYKDKKILFACDTGVGNIYKELGNKFGPIDLTLINIGAYNFYPMMPYKDKSSYHANPEEALSIAKDLKSKKVIGMHWGTFVLSLEPIMEPPVRFKNNAEKYGFKKEDALIFKIGEIQSLKNLFSYN
jgi:L-ascorbate metabolism protein UlaG (beta-lactamase superfamily)